MERNWNKVVIIIKLAVLGLLLFYAIATVLQLYHGGDMMFEIRRKSEHTRLLTQRSFNLLHHIGIV